jgi:hypothetical protein
MSETREAPVRSRTPRKVRRSVTAAAFGGALVLPFAGSAVAAVPVCACGGGSVPDADPPAPEPIDAGARDDGVPVPEHQPVSPPDPKPMEHQALRPTPEPLATEPEPLATEPEPVPEPAPAPEPVPEPAPAPEPAAPSVSEPAAVPEPAPEPVAGPVPEPMAGPEPKPMAGPEREPVVRPVRDPDAPLGATVPPPPSPDPEPIAEPEPQPVAEPEPQPVAEPEPRPQPIAEPEPEPVAGPEPIAEAEPAEPTVPEPEPEAEDTEAGAGANPPDPSPYSRRSAAAERWADSESSTLPDSSSAPDDAPEPNPQPGPWPAAPPTEDPKPEEHEALRPTLESAPEPSPYAGTPVDAPQHSDQTEAGPWVPPVPEVEPAPEPSEEDAAQGFVPIEHTFSTGWCPLGHNPNGSCRGSGAVSAVADTATDVANRTWHVSRFALNAPITAPSWAWAEANGGNCGFEDGLVVACYDTNSWANGPRGAITVGGTVLYEDSASEVSDAERAHEERHTDQWALFGLGVPPLYFGNEAVSQASGHGSCWNLFERWAGFQDGGYDDCE